MGSPQRSLLVSDIAPLAIGGGLFELGPLFLFNHGGREEYMR